MKKSTTSIFTICCFLFLSGCATPPGKFKDSDLTWSHVDISLNYQVVYRNVSEGFRRCGGKIAEGNLYTDIREGQIDIYLKDVFGGRSSWVYGIVRVKFKEEQISNFSVGVNNPYDSPMLGKQGEGRKTILSWANAKYDCTESK